MRTLAYGVVLGVCAYGRMDEWVYRCMSVGVHGYMGVGGSISVWMPRCVCIVDRCAGVGL